MTGTTSHETPGDRARRERVAQGLPPTVTDPDALAVLAAVAATLVDQRRPNGQ